MNVLFESRVLDSRVHVAERIAHGGDVKRVEVAQPLFHVDVLRAVLQHHHQLHFRVRHVAVAASTREHEALQKQGINSQRPSELCMGAELSRGCNERLSPPVFADCALTSCTLQP